MKVAIIGSGYVGLVTAAGLAEHGHQVTCVDVDPARVDAIRRSTPPFHEPGLSELLRMNVDRVSATVDLQEAVRQSDLSFIAVGTPFQEGGIDLRAVRAAATAIGLALRDHPRFHLVVVKSTVVPGTTDDVILPLLEAASGKQAGIQFGLAVNPEFLTEGEAIKDFLKPDRLVLGVSDDLSRTMLEKLYAGFEGVERVSTNPRTAEMIKYTANCLLATAISFSNEIANLCAAIGGIDIAEVMEGVHSSRYLTFATADGTSQRAGLASFLWAGCGFGGSCLPKDLHALIEHGRAVGQPMTLLRAVAEVNQSQPQRVTALVRRHFPSLEGVEVTVLGLSFRPGTSDMRESPAIPVIHRLLADGARVSAYDPAAQEEATRTFANGAVRLCPDLGSAVERADAVVVMTRWDEFRSLPDVLRTRGRNPLVVDGRRMLDRRSCTRYEGIGV